MPSDWGQGLGQSRQPPDVWGQSEITLQGYFRRTEEPHGGINALLPMEARSDAASGILHLQS